MTVAPIAVLGAGSWGTALAVHLSHKGEALLWARRADLAAAMESERRNPSYLSQVVLGETLRPTADLGLVAACDTVIVAVPSHGFRDVVRDLLQVRSRERPLCLVSATKGIEEHSLLRMSEVSGQEGERAGRDLSFAILSGPSFAEELAGGTPTAAVIASRDDEIARELQRRLSFANLRLYSTRDVVGVELGGAVKNVIAIAAGVATGLGLGYNSQAALVTRGLHEMTRLGVACGGEPRTFAGLAGLGDLVLTCTGPLSRNRRTGELLAQGRAAEEIESSLGMVAEGVRNSASIAQLAKRHDIEMPITEQMVRVIYQGLDPRRALDELMSRALKAESEL